MLLTRYHFRHAVSAFFELPRAAARQLLPPLLEPMEVNHGVGVFSATAFDFVDSEVGAYQELVLAVITPPRIPVGGDCPRSAFYPFLVGTSTEASRRHAIERWHLPHHMDDIAVDFFERNDRMRIRAHQRGCPVLDLDVSAHKWGSTRQLYQVFSTVADKLYKADIHMEGLFTEHEEETGCLVLHPHPMCERLRDAGIACYPFRELWQKDGVQSFEQMQTL
jgi:hypothetical protein